MTSCNDVIYDFPVDFYFSEVLLFISFQLKDPFTAKNNSQVFYCRSLSIVYIEVRNLVYINLITCNILFGVVCIGIYSAKVCSIFTESCG